MGMIHWYNPLTMEEEEVSAHVVKALIFMGEMFYREHRRGQLPG